MRSVQVSLVVILALCSYACKNREIKSPAHLDTAAEIFVIEEVDQLKLDEGLALAGNGVGELAPRITKTTDLRSLTQRHVAPSFLPSVQQQRSPTSISPSVATSSTGFPIPSQELLSPDSGPLRIDGTAIQAQTREARVPLPPASPAKRPFLRGGREVRSDASNPTKAPNEAPETPPLRGSAPQLPVVPRAADASKLSVYHTKSATADSGLRTINFRNAHELFHYFEENPTKKNSVDIAISSDSVTDFIKTTEFRTFFIIEKTRVSADDARQVILTVRPTSTYKLMFQDDPRQPIFLTQKPDSDLDSIVSVLASEQRSLLMNIENPLSNYANNEDYFKDLRSILQEKLGRYWKPFDEMPDLESYQKFVLENGGTLEDITSLERKYLQAKVARANSFTTAPDGSKLTLLEEIGRGGQGTVYRAELERNGKKRQLAVKHLKFRNDDFISMDALSGDFETSRALHDVEGIHHFRAAYKIRTNDGFDFYVISDLGQQVPTEGFTDPAAHRAYIQDIYNAEMGILAAGYVHRDLKRQNTILAGSKKEKRKGRIIDLGSAARSTTVSGTPAIGGSWLPPEYFKKNYDAYRKAAAERLDKMESEIKYQARSAETFQFAILYMDTKLPADELANLAINGGATQIFYRNHPFIDGEKLIGLVKTSEYADLFSPDEWSVLESCLNNDPFKRGDITQFAPLLDPLPMKKAAPQTKTRKSKVKDKSSAKP